MEQPLFEFTVRVNQDGSLTTSDNYGNLDELTKLQMLASVGMQAQHTLDIHKAHMVFMEKQSENIVNTYLNTLPSANDIENIVKKVLSEMGNKKPTITKL